MTDRFKLEEQIMECWGVVDNLRLVYSEEYQDATEDVKLNILIGLADLYDLKFQILQATMEQLIRERKLT